MQHTNTHWSQYWYCGAFGANSYNETYIETYTKTLSNQHNMCNINTPIGVDRELLAPLRKTRPTQRPENRHCWINIICATYEYPLVSRLTLRSFWRHFVQRDLYRDLYKDIVALTKHMQHTNTHWCRGWLCAAFGDPPAPLRRTMDLGGRAL